MDFQFQHTTHTTKLIIIALFLMVSYLLYALTVSVYNSYQIDLHIQKFEQENKRIEDENRKQSEDFEYYSSTAYIEKMAKQNLGLVNPGEEVIIIPTESFEYLESGRSQIYDDFAFGGDASNPAKWWKFFFDRESLSY
jgi:cell division protein FtsB